MTRDRAADLDPRLADPATLYGGGRYHLLMWRAAGSPHPDFDALVYDGDRRIKAALVDVLHEIPAPVAHHVIARSMIIGVGIDTLGWIDEHPDLPTTDEPVIRVALGCVAPGIIAHELAHVWHHYISPRAPRSALERKRNTELARIDLARAAVELGDTSWLEDLDRKPELAADAAATCWLGYVVDTCGPRRDAAIRAEIAALAGAGEEP